MTDQEINIAIAEVCGLKCKRCKGTGEYLRYGKHEWFRITCANKNAPKEQPAVKCDHCTPDEHLPFVELFPSYCTDLNAMHEALSVLTETEMWSFRFWNAKLTVRGEFFERNTARQWAEAWIRCKGLWRDAAQTAQLP